MTAEKFLITGGFFDNTSEGYIGRLSLRKELDSTELTYKTELIAEPPDEGLRMKNKGFAGGSIRNDLLWVCSANQVLAYNTSSFALERVIDDPLFNDLHFVLAEDDQLIVVNTGLESLDYFNYDGERVRRVQLTSSERTSFRTMGTEDFRTVDSKPHFMHANHCSRSLEGDLILTFVRQRRILNLEDWSWASPEYPAPPHEGFLDSYTPLGKQCLWITTVPGEIVASDPVTFETIRKWNLADYSIPPGWTRGLSVLDHGLLVGTSRIRKTNADYFSRWSNLDTQNSRTAVYYIPYDSGTDIAFTKVLDERNAKIFSILRLDN